MELNFLDPVDNPEYLGAISHYFVQSIVGAGGMGVVVRAFDKDLHRMVAIKVLSPLLAASTKFRSRFLFEARSAAAISHPNVVTIHAVGEQQNLPYLVMEYIGGRTLKEKIHEQGRLPVESILRISAQIAAGLAAAHAQGLVHRDIKPANILLEDGIERVKIADFGLARAAMDNSGLTSAGNLIGTPAYMSPEQVLGNPVDYRSDLFSMGCVMYCMVSGQSPFRGREAITITRNIVDNAPPPPWSIRPEIPRALSDVIERLISKDPRNRYQSASELHAELVRLQQEVATESTQTYQFTGDIPRPGGLRRLLVVAMIVVGLVSVTMTQFWSRLGVRDDNLVTTRQVPEPVERRVLRVGTAEGTDFPELPLALAAVAANQVIELVDSREYTGPFVIDRAVGDAVTIRAAAGVSAVLVAPPGTPVLRIEGARRLKVVGLKILARSRQTAIDLDGFLPGVTLENLEVGSEGDEGEPLVRMSPGAGGAAEAPLTVANSILTCQGGQCLWCEGGPARPVHHLRVTGCTLRSDRDGSLFVFWQSADSVEVDHNLFLRGAIALNFHFPESHPGRNLSVHHNTFFRNPWWFGLVGSVPASCVRVELTDNLVIQTGGVQNLEKYAGTLTPPGWRFAGNVWESAERDPAADEGAKVMEMLARRVDELPLASRTEGEPGFLKPVRPAEGAADGSGSANAAPGALQPDF